MKPAKTAKRHFDRTKLIVVEGAERISHTEVGDLATYLRDGDLLVVNRSSTLPSSFRNRALELRLAAFRGKHAQDLSRWAAVVFGSGDWRLPTEQRGPSPLLKVGEAIRFGTDLVATVTAVDPEFPRLVEVHFTAPDLVRALFEQGRPIQYSYLTEELAVWDQQTLFSGPSLSVEPPSAGFPFRWEQLLALKRRGIAVATLLHSAGLSSTGEPALDARFPLAEYYEIPKTTHEIIQRTRSAGGRVIALGTTVARALESAYRDQQPSLGGYTDLKLGPATPLRVVDALITGMHETGTSHAELMKAFCVVEALQAADSETHRLDYRSHEFGDLALLACPRVGLANSK